MGLGHSPSIVTNGLILCLDAANYKSFKGTPATNILNTMTMVEVLVPVVQTYLHMELD